MLLIIVICRKSCLIPIIFRLTRSNCITQKTWWKKRLEKKKTEIQNENLSDSESSDTNSVTMNSMGSNSSEEEMEKLIESDFANKTETTNDITSETPNEITSETIILKIIICFNLVL